MNFYDIYPKKFSKEFRFTQGCARFAKIASELTKAWSSGTTEFGVWIGNCNVKVWKSTEDKLHKIWNSNYFSQISAKRAHPCKVYLYHLHMLGSGDLCEDLTSIPQQGLFALFAYVRIRWSLLGSHIYYSTNTLDTIEVFIANDRGGFRGAQGARPPLGTQILSISCSFWENMAKSYVCAPPGRWRPPPGKSWIRRWMTMYNLLLPNLSATTTADCLWLHNSGLLMSRCSLIGVSQANALWYCTVPGYCVFVRLNGTFWDRLPNWRPICLHGWLKTRWQFDFLSRWDSDGI